ncbi:hypothetical protein TNCV_4861321 [Trichonephila clavipes]|nr:hypothetical protein TNCV_4861321 [Trichonephila clavipes]
MPSCHSVHDLELAVQDLWAHLSQDNIRCLINSMPDRVAMSSPTEQYGTFYEHQASRYAPDLRILRRKCMRSRKIVSRKVPTERYTEPPDVTICVNMNHYKSQVALKIRSVEGAAARYICRASNVYLLVWKLGEGVPVQVSPLSFDHGSKLRGASPIALVQLRIAMLI